MVMELFRSSNEVVSRKKAEKSHQPLLLREVYQHVAVGVEDLGLADKAKIVFLLIYDGQVPCTCILKYLHDLTHRHGVGEDGLRGVHELLHSKAIVQTRLEHDIAYLI